MRLYAEELVQYNKNVLSKYLKDYKNKDELFNQFTSEDFELPKMKFKEFYMSKVPRNKIANGSSTVEYWVYRGWTEEEALQKRKKIKTDPKKSPFSKLYWIEKGMTDVEANFKVKSLKPFNKEYWIVNENISEEEAILRVKKLQQKNSKKHYDNVKKDPIKYREKIPMRIEYYLAKGMTEEEAKNALKERQTTFSLKKCVEKYGEKNGLIIFNDRQIKWSKTLLQNGTLKHGHSKISQQLFNSIMRHYEYINMKSVFYFNKGGEYFLINDDSRFLYDFCDLNSRKIIEFNGDIYHANPELYEALDKPNPYSDLTSEQLWKKDEIKTQCAIDNGFEVLTIWENEYRKKPEEVLNKCLNFLNIEIC